MCRKERRRGNNGARACADAHGNGGTATLLRWRDEEWGYAECACPRPWRTPAPTRATVPTVQPTSVSALPLSAKTMMPAPPGSLGAECGRVPVTEACRSMCKAAEPCFERPARKGCDAWSQCEVMPVGVWKRWRAEAEAG